MGTTLSDIIVPELFNPYVIQKTLEKSALVQSGIVQNDAEFDKLASQASPLVNMPFFSDLTGESETVIEGDDLTADKISSKKDVAVILRRAKMWSATDLSAAMSGADPMAAIASLVSDFWVRDLQKELIAVLKGIFGTIPAVSDGSPKEAETRLASNILDISSASGNSAKWSGSAFIDVSGMGMVISGSFILPPLEELPPPPPDVPCRVIETVNGLDEVSPFVLPVLSTITIFDSTKEIVLIPLPL